MAKAVFNWQVPRRYLPANSVWIAIAAPAATGGGFSFGGAPATSAPAPANIFGAASNSTFGAQPTTATAFGIAPTSAAPAFGATATSAAPAFGGTPSFGTAFGAAPATATAGAPAFGTTPAAAPTFGTTPTSAAVATPSFGFGAAAATPAAGVGRNDAPQLKVSKSRVPLPTQLDYI